MTIDKPLVTAIRKDLAQFLGELKEKHNLDSSFEIKGTYSNNSISFRIRYVSLKSVLANTPPPLTLTKAEETKQAILLSNLGIPVNVLGKCVKFSNELYRITGVNNKPKYKIDLLTRGGKLSCCTVAMISASVQSNGILDI